MLSLAAQGRPAPRFPCEHDLRGRPSGKSVLDHRPLRWQREHHQLELCFFGHLLTRFRLLPAIQRLCVRSFSTSSKIYLLETQAHPQDQNSLVVRTCGCPDFIRTGCECQHIVLARRLFKLVYVQQPRATRQQAPLSPVPGPSREEQMDAERLILLDAFLEHERKFAA